MIEYEVPTLWLEGETPKTTNLELAECLVAGGLVASVESIFAEQSSEQRTAEANFKKRQSEAPYTDTHLWLDAPTPFK